MHRPGTLRTSALVRCLLPVLGSVIAALVIVSVPSQPVALAQSPTAGVLLQPGSLVYVGAFRLPASTGSGEQNTFEYGAEAMAYDPYRQSLWITGHDWHDRLAEVTIPALGQQASFRTPWIDMTWKNALDGSQVNMGGILPLSNGDLILSAYIYYDATGRQVSSHVRRRPGGSISPLTRIGTGSADGVRYAAGFVSGWMVPVPTEWQPLFGAPALTGNGSLSIVSRTSHGPALATFDPDEVGTSAVAASTQVLAYPINHPTLGTCQSGRIFNCASSNRRAGMVWIAGTRSLLYVHQQCEGNAQYAGGGWQCRGSRFTKVLAYDANDLLAVKNGSKRPWDIAPYAIWNLGGPVARSRVTSIAYDPVRKWVFMAEDHGDGLKPLIHVYEVDETVTSVSPASPTAPGLPAVGSRRTSPGGSTRRAIARFANTEGGEGGQGEGGGDGPGSNREPDGGPATTDISGSARRPLAGGKASTRSAAVRSAPENRQASPAPIAVCAGDNPYANTRGRIGVCVDGAWQLVSGVRTSGVVRHRPLGKGGDVWLIETDEAVYEAAGGLGTAYRTDGLVVLFEGHFTSRVPGAWPGSQVIELLTISVPPQ